MTAFMGVLRIAILATSRSHPLRALAALLLLSSALAPSLVAFAFSGAESLAVSGALGSAALLAPAVALFGGIVLAGGDRGGEGLAPLLRGPVNSTTVVAAEITGISAVAIIYSSIAALAAAAAISMSGREFDAAGFAGAVAAAWGSAPPAAAAGVLLAVAAPRALASALACLLAAAILCAPWVPAAGYGAPAVPLASVVLLARDAAFGGLAPSAVALSCVASLAAAVAIAAAATALLRVKDLAPAPEDA